MVSCIEFFVQRPRAKIVLWEAKVIIPSTLFCLEVGVCKGSAC